MSILSEAENIIHGERQEQYGSPKEQFLLVAKVWSGILGADVTVKEVLLCMAGLKLVREAYKHKADNLVDAAGYLAIIEMVEP